jgi:hypothetical protein
MMICRFQMIYSSQWLRGCFALTMVTWKSKPNLRMAILKAYMPIAQSCRQGVNITKQVNV